MDLKLGDRLKSLKGPVLITGHTGFKGTWLTLLLESLGIEVVGLSLPPMADSLYFRAQRNGLIHESFHDIRDAGGVKRVIQDFKPSAIFHLAAQPLVLESYKSPLQTFETNVLGTANLLEAAFQTDSVEAVIVATTDKVYRNNGLGVSFVEADPLAGRDPYSASKVGTEAAVAAWQQIAQVERGPKVISVRAGNVIGGGDWAANRLLPDLIRGFNTGVAIQVRNPESTRPWQHVLDPLQGYVIALEVLISGTPLKAINFGPNSNSLNVREVVDLARKEWGRETNVDYHAQNSESLTEAVSLQLNSQLAHEALGWKPNWSQEDAVLATVRWWKKVLSNSENPIEACQHDLEEILIK